MKPPSNIILKVAIPTPLSRAFDYLPPGGGGDTAPLQPGMRLAVPFGRGKAIGLLLAITAASEVPAQRLKRVHDVIDEQPVLPAELLQLLIWAAEYYHHPIGQVVASALPVLLRDGRPLPQHTYWSLTASGAQVVAASLTRAPRQAATLGILARHPDGASADELAGISGWRATMRTLQHKGWVQCTQNTHLPQSVPALNEPPAVLSAEQQHCVHQVLAAAGRYQTFLLEGITGSGKTEVYLELIAATLRQGRQTLVLVPEIGLTPQLVTRICRRFTTGIAVLHSGRNDSERLADWQAAASGSARIIIGTRSALFTPLPQAGLIILDEEHDPSFKQQDGFRYHARDLAIIRARELAIPVLLGSATPSLESLHNALQQRYVHLTLGRRHGVATLPQLQLLDLRRQPMEGPLSRTLLDAIGLRLQRDEQVLLFLNRRGYAPVLICHGCGWLARCERCDARMIHHRARQQLRCHHCDAQRPVPEQCPACGDGELRSVGFGTQRLEETLQQRFPDCEIIRIDRDSTRRKDSLQQIYQQIRAGRRQILIGTQMLAKGHDLPQVTLVGVLDADQGLFGVDFRASERMGQLITQVAGRAGRADKPGTVLIQTHHPEHPLLQRLINHDYHAYAMELLAERQQAGLPPYSHLALLRAEATHRDAPLTLLDGLHAMLDATRPAGLQLLGPVSAVMERRAGHYRAILLLQAAQRRSLHQAVELCLQHLATLPLARRVRWVLDIDPQEVM
ncbi:MAG: primosomal protein N' [Gammaproteobacteria bacterium]|nr:primosomal protein N' [Gammaproteobacteria bacterium]